jgi:hypothetical protein
VRSTTSTVLARSLGSAWRALLALSLAGCAEDDGDGTAPPAGDWGSPAVAMGGSADAAPSSAGLGGSVGGSIAPASASGGSSSRPDGGGGSAEPAGPFVPAEARLRLLTTRQYRETLRDLLGAAVPEDLNLEAEARISGYAELAAASLTLSGLATEQLEEAAFELAHAAVLDEATRRRLVTCTPSSSEDEECLRDFVSEFGRSVFRRPLEDDETERYAGLAVLAATTASDFWAGVEYSLAAFLQSPNFLYRAELGKPSDIGDGTRVLEAYEMASRLSFFLWGSTPDAQLLDAAQTGSLSTPEGVREEAERLLASPRAEASLLGVLAQMLRLEDLDKLEPSPDKFPLLTPTLGASMREETLRSLSDLLLVQNSDYRELLTTRTTFVNSELAAVYGLEPTLSPGFERITLPDGGPRAGLLGQASFLALNAHASATSPTLRGKFIREVLLCEAVPPPPPDVDVNLMDGDTTDRTMRDRLSEHAVNPACAGCHGRMDPLGLALEHFDAIGTYRDTDAGIPLDVTGDFDGTTFDGARKLGELLSTDPRTAECLVRNLYRVATGHLEEAGERAAIDALTSGFSTENFRVRPLLARIATSDVFRMIGAPR